MHQGVAEFSDTVGLGADWVGYPSMKGSTVDQALRCARKSPARSDHGQIVVEDALELAEEPNDIRCLQIACGSLDVQQADGGCFDDATEPGPLALQVGDRRLRGRVIFANGGELRDLSAAQMASANPSASS